MLVGEVEEKAPANERGSENYTKDGTVDLKGRPVSRSKTGRWRACSFIVGKFLTSRASCQEEEEEEFNCN